MNLILVVDPTAQHTALASSLPIAAVVVRTASNIHELIIDFRARAPILAVSHQARPAHRSRGVVQRSAEFDSL